MQIFCPADQRTHKLRELNSQQKPFLVTSSLRSVELTLCRQSQLIRSNVCTYHHSQLGQGVKCQITIWCSEILLCCASQAIGDQIILWRNWCSLQTGEQFAFRLQFDRQTYRGPRALWSLFQALLFPEKGRGQAPGWLGRGLFGWEGLRRRLVKGAIMASRLHLVHSTRLIHSIHWPAFWTKAVENEILPCGYDGYLRKMENDYFTNGGRMSWR